MTIYTGSEFALQPEQLRGLLDYDPATGVFMWKKKKRRNLPLSRPAGTLTVFGYRHIAIDGRAYKAHRLAWLHVHGEWPAGLLDHVDGKRDNNAIGNLRPANNTLNQANKPGGYGVAGLKGVRKQGQKWRAEIGSGGRKIHLGQFPTREEAHAVYMAKARELWGDFARAE